MPFHFEGGATKASVYGNHDDGFVINSTTCEYELRYLPYASSTQAMVKISISKDYYQRASDKLRGWCQNCNGDKDDDYRVCTNLHDVAGGVNTMEQISAGCAETDKTLITV